MKKLYFLSLLLLTISFSTGLAQDLEAYDTGPPLIIRSGSYALSDASGVDCTPSRSDVVAYDGWENATVEYYPAYTTTEAINTIYLDRVATPADLMLYNNTRNLAIDEAILSYKESLPDKPIYVSPAPEGYTLEIRYVKIE